MAELFDPNKNYNQTGVQAQPAATNMGAYAVPENPYQSAEPLQPQSWDPRAQLQPQTPVHHMPPAPVFGLPPIAQPSAPEEVATEKKTSRFKLKRNKKAKEAQAILENTDTVSDVSANDTPQRPKAKRSTASVFILGMAAGMAILFAGNMFVTNALQDSSSNEFKEIERRAMQTQQAPVPTSEMKAP